MSCTSYLEVILYTDIANKINPMSSCKPTDSESPEKCKQEEAIFFWVHTCDIQFWDHMSFPFYQNPISVDLDQIPCPDEMVGHNYVMVRL